MDFKIHSKFQPTGDQPQAIDKIVENIENGITDQILLGVTGSGKTFTVANVIERINRPALIMAPNKTLAAQLYNEYKQFFPENAVEFLAVDMGAMGDDQQTDEYTVSICVKDGSGPYNYTLRQHLVDLAKEK